MTQSPFAFFASFNKATRSYTDFLLHQRDFPPSAPRPHQPRTFALSPRCPFSKKLSYMLGLQIKLNVDTAPNWSTAGFAWAHAIAVEGVEGFCHYDSWKWWKHGKPSIEQAKLELIDIWHFILSWCMTRYGIFDNQSPTLVQALILKVTKALHELSVEYAQDGALEFVTNADINAAWMKVVGAAADRNTVDLKAFFQLCMFYDISLEELFQRYIQKNVLNFFRQKYGYKTGQYKKIWAKGFEDNEYLEKAFAESVKSLDFSNDESFSLLEDMLQAQLSHHYGVACENVWCLERAGESPVLGYPKGKGLFISETGVSIVHNESGSTVRRLPLVMK